jgi:hypothetical protein
MRQILTDICTRMEEFVVPGIVDKMWGWKPMSGPGCR